ncbi:MAG: hypothetical protein AAF764_01535 [Pseudomonadota bacterium]
MTRITMISLAAGAAIVATMAPAAYAKTSINILPPASLDMPKPDKAKGKTKAKVHKANWRGNRKEGRRAMMQFLRQADTNNDRALTQDELDAFIAGLVAEADTNRDGNLTVEEFRTVFSKITDQRAVRMFQRLDADASGSITAAEREERFGDLVARLDRNDDGKLSREDRRRGGWRNRDRGND